jgi:hypothetical protein
MSLLWTGNWDLECNLTYLTCPCFSPVILGTADHSLLCFIMKMIKLNSKNYYYFVKTEKSVVVWWLARLDIVYVDAERC